MRGFTIHAALLAAVAAPSIAHAQEAAVAEAAVPDAVAGEPAAGEEALPAEEEALPAEEEALPAPDAPESQAIGNDELITAGKREQPLGEIPVAMSVVGAGTIVRAQIRELGELAGLVPSLGVSAPTGIGGTYFSLRGFGRGPVGAGIEPAVGVYVDGVYRSPAAAAIAGLPDVKRIELLRGPQSVLYGKNASAGVIALTTQAPQFDFGGAVEASYGEGDAMVVKGTVTGPLSQKVAFALSAGLNLRDGQVRDLASATRLNDRERWFLRGQALLEPNSRTKVRLIADYDRIDEHCCAAFNLQRSAATLALEALGGRINLPADRFAGAVFTNTGATSRISNWGASGQIDYELGPVRLTSITAWRETAAASDRDADFTSADLLSRNAQDFSVHTFTQELRAATSFNFPIQVVLGASYFRETVDQASQLRFGNQLRPYADALIRAATGNAQTVSGLETALGRPAGSFFAAGTGSDEAFALTQTSFNLFGQVDYELSDRLTVTGGIAYIHDSKRFSARGSSSDAFASIVLPGALSALRGFQYLPPYLGLPNAVEPGRIADGKLTYTLRLAYELGQHARLYAGYATGYRASSIDLSRGTRPFLSDATALGTAGLLQANQGFGGRYAGPEAAKLYEAGFKADWGPVSANLAVFRQVIEGFQTSLLPGSGSGIGTGYVLGNAVRQSVDGFELEATVHPIEPLVFSLGLTHLDPQYDSFVASALGDLSGTRPAGIPSLSATFALQFTQRLANADNVILRGDFHYESPVAIVEGLPAFLAAGGTSAAIGAAQPFRREVSDLNLSLTWASHSGFELSLWARNLLDDRHLISIFDSPAQTGSISGYPNQPRTMGVTARFGF